MSGLGFGVMTGRMLGLVAVLVSSSSVQMAGRERKEKTQPELQDTAEKFTKRPSIKGFVN